MVLFPVSNDFIAVHQEISVKYIVYKVFAGCDVGVEFEIIAVKSVNFEPEPVVLQLSVGFHKALIISGL